MTVYYADSEGFILLARFIHECCNNSLFALNVNMNTELVGMSLDLGGYDENWEN